MSKTNKFMKCSSRNTGLRNVFSFVLTRKWLCTAKGEAGSSSKKGKGTASE
ncbi:hypothetical protein ES332_D03G059900v1 [Gossypium tomentosum]|uniref:Uncharacterized protein n=1 Tax=Gossypium tomentosum TaxID=34277 RepID=A0A5D2LMU6_GOSTO|nr:hypothetical protein ES332_D03G059900v1 [Gossypium tomentosum]